MKYLVVNNFTISLNLSHQIQEIFEFLIPIKYFRSLLNQDPELKKKKIRKRKRIQAPEPQTKQDVVPQRALGCKGWRPHIPLHISTTAEKVWPENQKPLEGWGSDLHTVQHVSKVQALELRTYILLWDHKTETFIRAVRCQPAPWLENREPSASPRKRSSRKHQSQSHLQHSFSHYPVWSRRGS